MAGYVVLVCDYNAEQSPNLRPLQTTANKLIHGSVVSVYIIDEGGMPAALLSRQASKECFPLAWFTAR